MSRSEGRNLFIEAPPADRETTLIAYTVFPLSLPFKVSPHASDTQTYIFITLVRPESVHNQTHAWAQATALRDFYAREERVNLSKLLGFFGMSNCF